MNRFRRLKEHRSLSWLVRVAGCLLMLSACAPQKAVTTPPVIWPSVVVTQAGMAYYVQNLRIPGTNQEIRFKQGETMTWLPLRELEQIRFSGPVQDRYRPALIILTSGEKIQGKVFVDFLLEGTTDLGYWNLPMAKVERLQMGLD